MTQMNKVMDPQKTMQVLKEFEKESTKMEMSEEMSEFSLFFYFPLIYNTSHKMLWRKLLFLNLKNVPDVTL